MDENSISFEDFEAAFIDDYQTTEPDTSDEGTETAEEVAPAEEAEGSEDPAGEETGDGEETECDTEEPEGGEEEKAAAETFTLKVNKEERTVSREEMIAFAQKGADYDRVKEQLVESRNANQELQGRLGKYESVIGVLEDIASASGQTLDQIAEQMQLNMLMKDGKSEGEARAEIRARKAEAQLKAAQDKETARKSAAEDTQARANREVAEFRKRFPDVELTEQLCQELAADVQKGVPLVEAYQNREIKRKDAEIAELKRKSDAAKQNNKNRNSSTGSQRDSGGRREKSDFDDFMSAFN